MLDEAAYAKSITLAGRDPVCQATDGSVANDRFRRVADADGLSDNIR
jgi:hypothetical protein